MRSDIMKKLLIVLIFPVLTGSQSLYATILYDFENGTLGWVYDNTVTSPTNVFNTNPIQTNFVWTGSKAIRYRGSFNGYSVGSGRIILGGGAGTNWSSLLASGNAFSVRLKCPDGLTVAEYLKIELYSRSGVSWTWHSANCSEGAANLVSGN